MPEFGVISGSGLYAIPGLLTRESVRVKTPYGDPSDSYSLGAISGREVAFLPRHGSGHRIQPHKINYRANLWGFRELGVKRVLSIGACGGIGEDMAPGAIVLPDQIIDHTSGRESTFFDSDEVVHIDFTDPFCSELRAHLASASEKSGVPVIGRGTCICVNGPRLETAAEIRTFASWGAELVGMTGMPECALARELGICFAGIAVITNRAAGMAGRKLTTKEVIDTMQSATERLMRLLAVFFGISFKGPSCLCSSSLEEAKL